MACARGSSNKNLNKVKKFALSKTDRLKSKQVIKELFSIGKRFHGGNLTVIYLHSEEQTAGFIASRSIGGAVKRNKVKRILREAYQMNKDIFKGLKVIFYVHGTLKFQEIVDIFKAFQEGR